MKNLIYSRTLLVAFALSTIMFGCSKDEDDSSNPSGSNNNNNNDSNKGFAFVMDGKSYDYSESANYFEYVGIIQAQSSRTATRPYNKVALNFDSISLGQHDIIDTLISPSASYTEFYTDSANHPQIDYEAIEGEIYIDSFNKEKETASGTFSFVGVSSRFSDTVRITNGEFNIKE